uniref:Uncharacterized protein n=1 Tax=Arion vulgaris TaxID=1028688 RepID=A0A0B7AZR4_9EUPU
MHSTRPEHEDNTIGHKQHRVLETDILIALKRHCGFKRTVIGDMISGRRDKRRPSATEH